MERRAHWLRGLLWTLFVLWLLAQLPTFVSLAQQNRSPIDFLAYRVAADAIVRGDSPYLTPSESQRIWHIFHDNETHVLAAGRHGQGQAALREIDARPQQPGPYVYPPSLALWLAQGRVSAFVFAGVTLLAMLGFAWLWLRSTGAHPIALLLIVLSLEALASLNGGNVELLLLFAVLPAAWLLWHGRALAATVPMVAVVLVKPFYVMLFVAFGLLLLVRDPSEARRTLRTVAMAAAASLTLIALEVWRWGPQLQAETLDYLRHALEHQWFVLPVDEQTPMSMWNRTPMQVFISVGLSPTEAQWGSVVLWLLLLGVTVWRTAGRRLNFPLTFALAFILLYLGRPVGWGLVYLEAVVALVVWPSLHGWHRPLLLVAIAVLMSSRYWALALTAQGYSMQLFTLQSADRPWETAMVLPLSYVLLLRVAARDTAQLRALSVEPEA